jgi:hypothetical protein
MVITKNNWINCLNYRVLMTVWFSWLYWLAITKEFNFMHQSVLVAVRFVNSVRRYSWSNFRTYGDENCVRNDAYPANNEPSAHSAHQAPENRVLSHWWHCVWISSRFVSRKLRVNRCLLDMGFLVTQFFPCMLCSETPMSKSLISNIYALNWRIAQRPRLIDA